MLCRQLSDFLLLSFDRGQHLCPLCNVLGHHPGQLRLLHLEPLVDPRISLYLFIFAFQVSFGLLCLPVVGNQLGSYELLDL